MCVGRYFRAYTSGLDVLIIHDKGVYTAYRPPGKGLHKSAESFKLIIVTADLHERTSYP